MDFEQMEYLCAFDRLGTLSAVAQQYHISQPALTKRMAKLEEELGVPLFIRRKNHLVLNEYGKQAAAFFGSALEAYGSFSASLREAWWKSRSISIASVAPAPALGVKSLLETSSCVLETNPVSALLAGTCDIAIVDRPFVTDEVDCVRLGTESLFVCVDPASPLASRPSVSFSDLDGLPVLLYSTTGFWQEFVEKRMPASRFVLESDADILNLLASTSSLLRFKTNWSLHNPANVDRRIAIPVADASHTFYACTRKKDRPLLDRLAAFSSLDWSKVYTSVFLE